MTNEFSEDDPLREVEERLRSLRPVAPRALRVQERSPLRMALAFSVAVGLCVIAAIAVTQGTKLHREAEVGIATEVPDDRTPFTSSVVTVGQLNTALCAGDEAFFQLLDQTSPYILSRGQEGTALYELGKE